MRTTSMPILVKVGLGQRYARRTLAPGASKPHGQCLGLSMAWLRRIQCGATLDELPTFMEGALGQSIYVCGYDAASWVTNTAPAFNHSRHLHAMAATLGRRAGARQSVSPFAIADVVQGQWAPGARKTFLLQMYGHAMGLALVDTEVGLFDSNSGAYVYKIGVKEEMTSLTNVLTRLVFRYTGQPSKIGMSPILY